MPNIRILNRENKLPADGWHQFEVLGEHVNHEAKVVQVIDARAIASILNRFQQDAAAPNFAGILVDQDHFSLDTSKPTEAMGWALELRNREGVPESRIDWTAAGRPKVEGKDYKFFSTVYDPQECEQLGSRIVNGKPYKLVRPLRLDRLALTNDPNNKGGKPISNREGNPADTDENQNTSQMKSVMKALGLAEDASEASALDALTKIQNRATTAEGQVTTLTTENKTLLAAQVDSDLEKYANRFKPENKETIRKQLIANRAGAIELLEATEPGKETKKDPGHITNRQTAQTPQEKDAVAQKEKEHARAARITNRAHVIAREQRVSFTQAFSKAEREEAAV